MAKWQQDLHEFARLFQGADLSEAFLAVDQVVSEGFEQNFYNTTDESGNFWPPHAPSTVKRYGPHDLLILTGKMFRAATQPGDAGHLHRVEDNATLVMGIREAHVPYAIYHHLGTSRMPRRRVIYATQETVQRALDVFSEKAEQAILH